jgi:cell division protein FtsB
MLPWYIDWNEWTDEQFEAWLDGLEYNCNGWMEKETPPEKIDYYHEKHKGLNLAQVVYRLCRYVPPVGLHPFETEREQMIEDGMEEAKACKLSDMAELMFLHSFQAKLYRRPRHYDSKEEEEAEKAKLEKEQESLTHAIDSLKKEIAKYGQQCEADVTREDVTRLYLAMK